MTTSGVLKNEDAGLEIWMKAVSHWTSAVVYLEWNVMSDCPSTRWSAFLTAGRGTWHQLELSSPSSPTQPFLAGLYGHICLKGKFSLLPHFPITLPIFFVVYLTQMTAFSFSGWRGMTSLFLSTLHMATQNLGYTQDIRQGVLSKNEYDSLESVTFFGSRTGLCQIKIGV